MKCPHCNGVLVVYDTIDNDYAEDGVIYDITIMSCEKCRKTYTVEEKYVRESARILDEDDND